MLRDGECFAALAGDGGQLQTRRQPLRRPSKGSLLATYRSRQQQKLAEYGLKPRAGSVPTEAMMVAPPQPTQPPISISSTGGLLLSPAWMPTAPPAAASATTAAASLLGGGGGGQRTVPRLMPTASTFEELDQLSALLRRRAELSQAGPTSRPSTAAARPPRR